MNNADLALVLTGGGARGAYQVGVLKYLASRHPDLSPGILTGVSAGGINATHLAARGETFADSVAELTRLWRSLRIDDVFRVNPINLTSLVARWGLRLIGGGMRGTPNARSLVDTAPLRELLVGAFNATSDGNIPAVAKRLGTDTLHALALTASSYSTGQSVTWVQDRETCSVLTWEQPPPQNLAASLHIDHVLASSALPFFFPAVQIDGTWYGDGGIRLNAPLSPAIHLGASRIVAVSTRWQRTRLERDRPTNSPYPPPVQVAGVLLNAIFLDLLDADARQLERINGLIDPLPLRVRGGMRHVDLLVLRPSKDLGRLAAEYEVDLPRGFRFLVRGLGSRETRANDILSLLMFQPDYLARLIELGEADARARASEIDAFLYPAVVARMAVQR
jgi:NTE family protein